MEKFTIGQLAKKANVNLETIRYYERRRLLPEPSRNKSGRRQYLTLYSVYAFCFVLEVL